MLYVGTFNIDEPRFGCAVLKSVKEKKMEMSFMAYVRIEGRITIPLEIRDAMEIKRGDLVECRIKRVR